MFEDERRSATVEAIETTSVIGVLGPDMRRLMSEHPRSRCGWWSRSGAG